MLGHYRIMRVDHWVKNVLVFPGVVVALSMHAGAIGAGLGQALALGMLAVCLVASSNYVLNEVLDATYDKVHPAKVTRPVPAGQVSVPLAYAQWLVLMLLGIGLASLVSERLVWTLLGLWAMGVAYNVRPIRTKDVIFFDVVSEAINNPLRFLAGWFIVDAVALPPVSLLFSYWAVGCYFMAIKRFAELREIGDQGRASGYRSSFGYYDERRLIVSIMFYASIAMLFFGAFIVRYRMELILSFPLVAAVMAAYLSVGFKDGSAVQTPEKIHREPLLFASIVCCAVVLDVLLFVDIPVLHEMFPATLRRF